MEHGGEDTSDLAEQRGSSTSESIAARYAGHDDGREVLQRGIRGKKLFLIFDDVIANSPT